MYSQGLPATSSFVSVVTVSGPGKGRASGGVPGQIGTCECPADGCHTVCWALTAIAQLHQATIQTARARLLSKVHHHSHEICRSRHSKCMALFVWAFARTEAGIDSVNTRFCRIRKSCIPARSRCGERLNRICGGVAARAGDAVIRLAR